LGVLARSKALLSDDRSTEPRYREAIERLERSLARAHLVDREWLRRQNRPRDGREHLRTDYRAFSGIGARAFAERARRELVATGEAVRKRTGRTPEGLTAQERQIALLCAEGNTNLEIGGQLFISPRTVEYHLSKVYTKLGISSRRDLGAALRVAEPTPSSA
jgi:DNA-binding CsgD family transcriptional regulator